MSHVPRLQGLVEAVRADARSEDPLEQLRQAAQMVGELEALSDALLGYFVELSRRFGQSWSQISTVLGVSKQAAHKRFTGPGRSGLPTMERFSERARLVLGEAAEQARSIGHRFVGTEHLPLALFEPGEALAAQLLREVGISRAAVKAKVPAGESETSETTELLAYTPGALDALRSAVGEALKLGQHDIGTEHLLLALFDDSEALGSQILTSLGASYEGMRERVLTKFAGPR